MLIATLIAYFLMSGGSTPPFARTLKVTTEHVKKAVPDGAERKRALSVLEQMETALKHDERAVKELEESLKKAGAHRADAAQGLEVAYGTFEKERIVTEEKLVELRFRLKDSLSREEWGKVFPKK